MWDRFRKFLSKKRQLAALTIIIVLLVVIGLNSYLPVGPGDYNQRQVDKIHSAPSSDHFSFAVMGDTKNSFKIFRKILKNIDDEHYIFAINVGDLIFDGEKEKYRIFYNMIKSEETPLLVAVGNHDIREGGAENYFDIFDKNGFWITHKWLVILILIIIVLAIDIFISKIQEIIKLKKR